MSKITNLIFNGENHYKTSDYGYRKVISTKGGYTNSFHNGTDYGTNGKKIAQYAIENGTILSCGTDSLGGKYAWVKYPRLNVKMLHYHLDSVSCKTGQAVSKGTLIGYTGMTGKATGVHLHLSIVNLANGQYLNPETYNYSEPIVAASNDFFNGKKCLQYGDSGSNVHALCEFFANNYWGYFGNTKQSAHDKLLGKNGKGDYFGPNLKAWVTDFQRRTGLEQDGRVGPITLAKLVEKGFRY